MAASLLPSKFDVDLSSPDFNDVRSVRIYLTEGWKTQAPEILEKIPTSFPNVAYVALVNPDSYPEVCLREPW